MDEQSWFLFYEGAKILKLEQLIEDCQTFFKIIINSTNVVENWTRLVIGTGNESLIEIGLRTIFENVQDVCASKEFGDLNWDQV